MPGEAGAGPSLSRLASFKGRLIFPTESDQHSRIFPSIIHEMADGLFAVVFPTSCSLCHQEIIRAGNIDICPACWDQIAPWNGAACSQCGLPFASERATDSVAPLCPDCRNGEFEFDAARSYGLYSGTLRA